MTQKAQKETSNQFMEYHRKGVFVSFVLFVGNVCKSYLEHAQYQLITLEL